MNILALETSTDACSAALRTDSGLTERYEVAPRRHVERLLPMIRELLAEAGMELAGLDGIAFGAGPGSFTGVRIAVSAAQGLGLGAGLPLVGVSSLAALALAAVSRDVERVYVIQDARMGEVYAGAFEADGADGLSVLMPDRLLAPDLVRLEGRWWLAGGGWDRYPQMLADTDAEWSDTGLRFPRAAEVARLARPRFAAGDTISAREAEPHYLRKTVAAAPS